MKKIIRPIELISPWLPKGIHAITLWPFIFYRSQYKNNMPLRSHEYFHWYQALKFGVFPWYVTYLVLRIFYSYSNHPLEKQAFAEEYHVKQLIKHHKKISDYIEKKYLI